MMRDEAAAQGRKGRYKLKVNNKIKIIIIIFIVLFDDGWWTFQYKNKIIICHYYISNNIYKINNYHNIIFI